MRTKAKNTLAGPTAFLAWAIDLNTAEGHGLAGRYFWARDNIPTHLEGCLIALFTTRKVARLARDQAKQSGIYPKARVARVKVTIKTQRLD